MNLNCDLSHFLAPTGRKGTAAFKLKRRPTEVDRLYKSKKHHGKLLDEFTSELVELQEVLYAHGRYALLLIFQGMDTAGKDGVIRHVMSGVNPQGCQVHSFKQPSSGELAHDFLWRTTKRLPMRGHIGIFNRSYYEEVLIAKAEPVVLASQLLPEETLASKTLWRDRYRDIRAFEQFLRRNGTVVLKFFLHLSKEEQRKRLLARATDPKKHWKVSPSDLESRSKWDDYQGVYEDCIRETSHPDAPWHVVPADDKRNARLIVSHAVVEALRALPLRYPEVSDEQKDAVAAIRKALKK